MLRTFTVSTTRTVFKAVMARRTFTTTYARQAAKIYEMPAMSPTMDEGGVVEWKVKEGQEFSAGDELLDVETDKATMEVNAGDDGIMAKILVPAGTNGVKVGAPIAFLADPGDDLATLEYPDISAAAAAPEAAKPAPAAAPAESPAAPAKAPSFTGGKANPDQTFFPSVEFLLAENKISREDALQKITATGPKGKILKGDVLAYLGKIPADDNTKIASFLEDREKLDLSHIELATPEAAAETAEGSEGAAAADSSAAAPAKPAKQPVVVSHQFVISSAVPSKILAALVAKAASKAETAAYATKNYKSSDLVDPLFEDLIAPPANTERFKVNYSINTTPAPSAAISESIVDEFDFEPYEEPVKSSKPELLTTVDVELTCNEKVIDSKTKAGVFVSKFGNYLGQIDRKFTRV
ncbi:hypothetical protein FOA43_000431 [Brettanomyces nanus]|uniref:Dihydrolipoamide dehydrogenase-binding protein of pyruvate dehydrogenase complex n=1 Tax=Eeniella nana TaxID=13502 RepID=A0A875RWB5_EENNA|nr:uncharacterized protein FOA43_000431 [Brettanomyces nanus]QPG73126.1 hypothetical protein FOA43_000431 [Brettanomyces nanus]